MFQVCGKSWPFVLVDLRADPLVPRTCLDSGASHSILPRRFRIPSWRLSCTVRRRLSSMTSSSEVAPVAIMACCINRSSTSTRVRFVPRCSEFQAVDLQRPHRFISFAIDAADLLSSDRSRGIQTLPHRLHLGSCLQVIKGMTLPPYFSLAPSGTSSRNPASTGAPSGGRDAASSMPFDSSPRILRGARLATITILRPMSFSGS